MEDKLKELRCDADELQKLLDSAERTGVKNILTVDLRRLQTEITTLKAQSGSSSADTGAPSKRVSSAPRGPYDVQIKNYSWEQSDKFVKLYMTSLKDVQSLDKGNIKCDITDKSVSLRVNDLDGKNHIFSIKEVAYNVNPEKSYFKVKTDMISIFLSKVSEENWKCLTKAEKVAADVKAENLKAPESPSGGMDNLMQMMKKLFDDGDDERKRAIAKAWSEKGANGLNF